MSGLVMIADTTGGVFLHPSMVVDALGPDADQLHWSILDFREAVSDSIDVVELDARVSADPLGLSDVCRTLSDWPPGSSGDRPIACRVR